MKNKRMSIMKLSAVILTVIIGSVFALNMAVSARLSKKYEVPESKNSVPETEFMSAIRTGKRPDGSEIRFPMPWKNFSKMSYTELKALYLYLKKS